MEKNDTSKLNVDSPYILGQLYRAVDCKDFYKKSIKVDWDKSICLNYKLNQKIIRSFTLQGGTYCRNFHKFLIVAYDRIVMPLNKKIRDLMVQYTIANESELFCTHLTFSLSDDTFNKRIGDPGNKDEDAVKALNLRLQEYIKIFRLEFEELKTIQKCSP